MLRHMAIKKLSAIRIHWAMGMRSKSRRSSSRQFKVQRCAIRVLSNQVSIVSHTPNFATCRAAPADGQSHCGLKRWSLGQSGCLVLGIFGVIKVYISCLNPIRNFSDMMGDRAFMSKGSLQQTENTCTPIEIDKKCVQRAVGLRTKKLLVLFVNSDSVDFIFFSPCTKTMVKYFKIKTNYLEINR